MIIIVKHITLQSCPARNLFFCFFNFYVFKKQRAVQNNATPGFAPDSKSSLYKLSNDVSFDPEFFQEGGENQKNLYPFYSGEQLRWNAY